MRTLMIRYMELESEHEALFPASTPGHGVLHTREFISTSELAIN